MIQTQWVIERLHQQWPTLEIVVEQIRTTGDRITHAPLTQIGGDGVFVIEIERALQERRIDLAVHSLKDLPTLQAAGLQLIVTGTREDVRDVLIYKTILPAQSLPTLLNMTATRQETLRVGTSSLRRAAQMRAMCSPESQVQFLPIRGNVDTRLRKLEIGEYDAIVLASAGLHRLHLHQSLAKQMLYLPIEYILPAPGQGALALEFRAEQEMQDLIAPLQDFTVQAATSAERMFMRQLGAGCYLPVAAYCEQYDDILLLQGLVISEDGQTSVRVRQQIHWDKQSTLHDAELLGIRAAEDALSQGAQTIVNSVVRDISTGQEFNEVNESREVVDKQEHSHV